MMDQEGTFEKTANLGFYHSALTRRGIVPLETIHEPKVHLWDPIV